MKKLFFAVMGLITSLELFGQQVVVYNYDSAGNRTERKSGDILVKPTSDTIVLASKIEPQSRLLSRGAVDPSLFSSRSTPEADAVLAFGWENQLCFYKPERRFFFYEPEPSVIKAGKTYRKQR